jgi:hypothetical protein
MIFRHGSQKSEGSTTETAESSEVNKGWIKLPSCGHQTVTQTLFAEAKPTANQCCTVVLMTLIENQSIITI